MKKTQIKIWKTTAARGFSRMLGSIDCMHIRDGRIVCSLGRGCTNIILASAACFLKLCQIMTSTCYIALRCSQDLLKVMLWHQLSDELERLHIHQRVLSGRRHHPPWSIILKTSVTRTWRTKLGLPSATRVIERMLSKHLVCSNNVLLLYDTLFFNGRRLQQR
jgi:hypothetical protein